MPTHSPAWYEEQYNNRARIPEHPAIFQRWADDSAAARAALNAKGAARLDVQYGTGAGETLDVFAPPRGKKAAPVLVFIHGGYWRALDKRDHSFIAPPFVTEGALVVVVNYALCPAVSIEHICLQMTRALAWVYEHAADYGGDCRRIVVAGHSAGGHLAAMMLACDWQVVGAAVETNLPANLVKSALSISGVFDLEPLRHVEFLAADLKLTAASARKLSPAKFAAPPGYVIAVVGGDESDEFLRQNALIARAWGTQTVVACEAIDGFNHLSVLGELARPASQVHRWALQLLED